MPRHIMTRESVRRAMETDDRILYACIIRIYQNQLVEEKKSGCTQFHNKLGFNKPDAYRMSYFARLVLAGCTLSSHQLREARERMPKYSGQLACFGWPALFRCLEGIRYKSAPRDRDDP